MAEQLRGKQKLLVSVPPPPPPPNGSGALVEGSTRAGPASSACSVPLLWGTPLRVPAPCPHAWRRAEGAKLTGAAGPDAEQAEWGSGGQVGPGVPTSTGRVSRTGPPGNGVRGLGAGVRDLQEKWGIN